MVLTDRRKLLGLSQSEVARRMGTTQSAVSDIEKLVSVPRTATFIRYVHACGGAVTMEVRLPELAVNHANEGVPR